MPEQDLKIKISVEDKASGALKNVKGNLQEINDFVGKIQNKGAGLPAITKQLDSFANALTKFGKIDGQGIYSLGKNVNHMLVTLGRLDVGKYSANIDKTTEQLGKMAQTFANFAGDGGKMDKGVEGLEKLPRAFSALESIPKDKMEGLAGVLATLAAYTAKASKNGSGINALAEGLGKLPNALDKFGAAEDYKESIEEVKKTLEQFGDMSVKGGASFESVASGIGKLPEALREFGQAETYAKGIEQVALALNMLEPAVSNIYKYGNGIGSLADGLSKLPGALSGFKADADYSANIQKIGEVLEELGKVVQKVDTEATKGFRGLTNAITNLRRSAGDENLDEKLRALAVSIQQFVNNLNGITDEQAQKVYNLGVGLKSMVDASRGLEQAQKNLSTSSGVGRAIGTIKDGVKNLVSWLKKVPGWVSKAFKALGKIFSLPYRSFAESLKSLGQRIGGFLHSIGRIALYRAIRSGLKMITEGAKEGIDNLYKWAQVVGNDFAPTMDHLASEFLYLKNSVGAAISPIIQAIEPVVTTLIHKFVELLNVFNQFVSMVTGRDTYRRAIYYATTYGDQIEDSMTGAGKAAKELENILMDFDQLNLITTPKDRTSGSGADDEENWALMFEEVPVDNSLFAWLDNVDWTALGKKFSDKIASMLKSINWTKIKNKTKSLATKFATLLNGIFTNEDLFTTLGASVAEGLNTVALGINTFTSTTNWEGLGTNLAKGLKTFIDTADPDRIGRALAAPFTTLADIIHGFTAEMTTDDWKKIATSVYSAFTGALGAIPWETLIPDLVELATGLVMAITAAIKAINDQWPRIKQGLSNADFDALFNEVSKFLGELFKNKIFQVSIGIALTGSVLSFAFQMAGKALEQKMLTTALANALGGSASGAGASGALSALGGTAGAGGAMAALPYVAVAIACVVTAVVSQIKWRDAQGKQVTSTSLADAFKKGEVTDFTFLSDADGSSAFISDEDYAKVIANLGDYKDRLKELYGLGMANPSQLGLSNTSEVESWYSNMLASLNEGGYTAARVGLQIDTLWDKWGKFIEASKKSANNPQSGGLFGLVRQSTTTTKKVGNDLTYLSRLYTSTEDGLIDYSGKTTEELKKEEEERVYNSEQAYVLEQSLLEKRIMQANELGLLSWDQVKGAYDVMRNGTHAEVNGLCDELDVLIGSVGDYGSEAMQNAWTGIDSIIASYRSGAQEGGKGIDTGLAAGVNNNFNGTIGKAMNEAADKVKQKFNLHDNAYTLGKKTITGFGAGLKDGRKSYVSTELDEVVTLVKSKLGLKAQATTWGKDVADGLAAGMNANEAVVTGAAIGLASTINKNVAFSEPEEGPLSDFHTYMPDMIDLMVQGIKENQYRVENAVTGLAGTVAGIKSAAVDPSTYGGGNNQTQSMADDLYNANAEERQLLRELISAVREQRLTISPSASLGKVVNQSTRLYAGVTG